ncbi:SMI1/KNR4 family protein [Glycomyces buryatensis]|uniref:SMI1/KNR4 family protein n=1 Tax=Glycomyces buryatensis TaxID=2570927 RepID=A0A4S8Q9S3_9ACTN|nr:SMI1/KNR4 family protein [Glycomyces buryatensis]THV41213.1 SMI1/KNR4 family protein [Glycomyces buryatensis]
MSEQHLADLLGQAGRALGPLLHAPAVSAQIPEPLKPLLMKQNGFYAFGPALFVRPWGPDIPGNCLWWNASNTWRNEYNGTGDDLLFFAEDIFGFQFAIHPDGFYQFDPETADREFMGEDIFEWAGTLMDDLDFYSGRHVAQTWQELNGRLPVGKRLAPAIPFAFGGRFEAEHQAAIPDVELMRFRGDIYMQTKDLPDGATIEFRG